MKNSLRDIVCGGIVWVMSLAFVSTVVTSCSDGDKAAGGSTEDAGIIADLNVAGVTQKGPFVKGSEVTVQGIDCKTLKFTDEIFEGKVKSDKGDFTVEDVSLKSTCALFEVTGIYRNEISGKKSSEKLTLHALTDLKDRKNVNINVLTELEYERLMFLVTEKDKKFAEAKAQAEEEVLAAFDIKGDFVEFENLNIFESGDENAALLAVSVMMQAETDDAGLVTRMEKFADSFAETGKWKDSGTKKMISEWAIEVTANGGLDSIRKNVEAWDLGDTVPAFEKFIEAYADGDSIVLIVTPKSSSSKNGDAGTESGMTSSSSSQDTTYNAEKNTLTDTRDGQTYRTVKIGDQVWMAENLNFETDSSYCYNDSAEYCAKYGRLYEWSAAMDACPSGWHLPDTAEWRTLLDAVGGDSIAGTMLKSTSGWNSDGNGTDDFGFTVLPAGGWDNKMFEGEAAGFWSSVGYGNYAAAIRLLADAFAVRLISGRTYVGHSVRCVKGSATAPKSSSSSENVILSGDSHEGSSSSSVTLATPCKTETEDNCEYGTLTDSRDGQTYKTVEIGSQVWMAENLNYAYTGVLYNNSGYTSDSTSWCFGNDPANCIKYGRLYTWAAAMDSVGTWSTNGKDCGYGVQCTPIYPVRGICPEGWHLPDKAEWNTLFTAVGGASTAGKMLSSTISWSSVPGGWVRDGYGTDAYSFSALPAGLRNATGYNNVGYHAYFWSSSEYNSSRTYIVGLDDEFDKADLYGSGKDYGYSVRCLKNDDATAPKSSSSSAAPCKTETEDNCEYGTLTDSRDGQTYKTVEIGSQVWMAENLNYAYTGVLYNNSGYTSDSTSWCFGNDPANCIKYGRLYTWAAAMDSVGTWSTNGKDCGYGVQCTPIYPVRGICPEGWHLPDKAEWNTLFTAVGGASTAGKMLSSTISWSSVPGGWVRDGYGTDAYSFSALPAGLRNATGYNNVGYHAYFWSSSEYNSSRTYIVGLDDEFDKADLYGSGKDYGYSVRCVKD